MPASAHVYSAGLPGGLRPSRVGDARPDGKDGKIDFGFSYRKSTKPNGSAPGHADRATPTTLSSTDLTTGLGRDHLVGGKASASKDRVRVPCL